MHFVGENTNKGQKMHFVVRLNSGYYR